MTLRRHMSPPSAELLTRYGVLYILAEMGIKMPHATRVPDEELMKRLEQALYSAQLLDQLYPYLLMLDELPTIPLGCVRQDAATGQENGPAQVAMEAGTLAKTRLHGRTRRITNEINPLSHPALALYVTLNWLAELWDAGKSCAIVLVKGRKCHFKITVRMLSVRETEHGIPLILVLFSFFTPDEHPREFVAWISDNFQGADSVSSQCISATIPEAALLIKLLTTNRRYLPADLRLASERGPTERNFVTSFLAPLAPLSFDDVLEVYSGNVCAICEKKASRRCSCCDCVPYCSRACQRAHWKEHKGMCQSVKGGTWHTVRFVSAADVDGNGSGSGSGPEPEPDLYGQNPFVLQVNKPAGDGALLRIEEVYGSLYAWLRESDAPEAFRILRRDLESAPAGESTVFRWARRVGKWEVRICTNRAAPETCMVEVDSKDL